jgi:DNA repair photolyase
MIVRDVDVLQDVFRATSGSSVCISVPTVDEHAWRTLEPGTAHPMQRLRAVRTLVDSGIDAGVLMAPLVPGFSTHPAKIEATVKAVADHGARFVGANVLFLDGGTRDHFMRFLEQEFPAMSAQYEHLYATKYASRDYVERVKNTVGLLKARYGLAARYPRGGEEHDTAPAPVVAREEQAEFRF